MARPPPSMAEPITIVPIRSIPVTGRGDPLVLAVLELLAVVAVGVELPELPLDPVVDPPEPLEPELPPLELVVPVTTIVPFILGWILQM